MGGRGCRRRLGWGWTGGGGCGQLHQGAGAYPAAARRSVPQPNSWTYVLTHATYVLALTSKQRQEISRQAAEGEDDRGRDDERETHGVALLLRTGAKSRHWSAYATRLE